MKNNIFLDKKKWQKKQVNGFKIIYKSFDFKKNYSLLTKVLSSNNNFKGLSKFVSSLEGNFALILKKDKNIFAATDKIRSFPLLYYFDGNKFFIFDNWKSIKSLSFKKIINKKQVLFFALSGYTFGEEALYKNIKQINPGTTISFFKNKIEKVNYYSSVNSKKVKIIELEKKLVNINEKIILNLIKSCKGKHIVIPLSAGYDSRFILSGLKEYGFDNITTFSYGRKNNREANIASVLSKKLNVPWHYISYTNKKLKTIMKSEEHKKYRQFADSLTAIHFPQDFMAIKYLNDNSIIPKNSVIINGQSGDFISGNHLPNLSYNKKNIIENLVSYYISKHYKLWNECYLEKKTMLSEIILASIKSKINSISSKNIHNIYENLEFQNRQSKYVINGQRLYEFFNYEWRLPLWDCLYLDFWNTVPREYKLNQKLYKTTLHNTNWANVWNNIPINPKNSFSFSSTIIRTFFKSFFLFTGKDAWHSFEKKYLNYYIDPLCGYAQWNYKKIIADPRTFRNSLSWQTEEYLKEKNINWEEII